MNSEAIHSSEGHSTGDRRLWIALVILCGIGAGAVIRRLVAFETAPLASSSEVARLDTHFANQARIILLHIVPSLLFVLLVPFQFVSALRQRRPQLHQLLSRVIMGLGAVIGISALWLSTHPLGGLAEGTATTFFGYFFLFCLAKAWWHMRNGREALYREWFTRMVAIALGVATTRPIIGIFFATRTLTGLTPQQFFGPAMWLGFVSTYLAGEAWINHTRSRTVLNPHEAISYGAEKIR
jgi:predicted membrane protein DUF2306